MEKSYGRFGIKTLLKSFHFAIKGIQQVIRKEQNMRIHIMIAAITAFAGIIFQIKRQEWIIIIFCMGFVFVTEMVNTAIEKSVDLVSQSENKKAGIIKDIAAGAVFIAAFTALVIGLIIFIPYLLK